MNIELFKEEIFVQCQNVQCGAKLAAEIHYMYKDAVCSDDIFLIESIIGFFSDLKYMISYHSDIKAREDGHKSVYIYKHEYVKQLIDAIDLIKDRDSVLYHFASGKLFGYGDYEVMEFIKEHCK